MEPIHVAIFAKQPIPGQVKTRLARSIGESAAASLYAAMLEDTVSAVAESGAARVLVLHQGAEPRRWLPAGLPAGWELAHQAPGDLGARLAAGVAEAAGRAMLPLLMLGSDSPDLPRELLASALSLASTHDLVLGPTADGGVWCIGLRADRPGLFIDIPWSQPGTGEALRNRALELGLKIGELPQWRDVDVWEDLLDLAERLAEADGGAERTLAWLARHEGSWRTPTNSIGLE